MAVRKRRSSYQVDITHGEQRIRATFATEAEAEGYELEVRAALKMGRAIPQPPRFLSGRPTQGETTIAELVATVTRLRWSHNKDAKGHERDARLFMDYTGRNMAAREALTTTTLEGYVASLGDRLSGTTINRRLAPVSVLVKAATAAKIITEHVTIPRQRATPGRDRWYTRDEVAQIVETTKTLAPDYAYLFLFLTYTGARLGEAEKLDWRHVDMKGQRVAFMGTKNGENRGVALAPAALEALRQLERKYSNRPGPFWFVSRHKLKTVWSQLRGQLDWLDDECVVHTFRHTCASWLTQAGVDQHHIMNWMGHKSPTMTQRYAHLAPRNHVAMAGVLAAAGLEPARL